MQDFSSKFFFVHTWDDTAMVQNVLKEVEHELNVKLTSDINATQSFVLTDEVYKKIEDAEFVIVFISKSSATCEYFAGCVTRSLHLNKSILPLEIEKLGLFNNSMKEFNFRKKPYSFVDNDSKAMFFAQLKATLGFNVESGDSFGALIHIVVDRDARIMRYGEVLGVARAGEDCKIRLTKGSHLLDIVDIERPDLKYSPTCNVKSNDEEQFLNIPLTEILEQQQHKAEMERRRLESLRQREMRQAVKQAREEFEKNQEELLNKKKEKKDNAEGCGCWIIFLLVGLSYNHPKTIYRGLTDYSSSRLCLPSKEGGAKKQDFSRRKVLVAQQPFHHR